MNWVFVLLLPIVLSKEYKPKLSKVPCMGAMLLCTDEEIWVNIAVPFVLACIYICACGVWNKRGVREWNFE